jgi:lipopolysaccharide export system permease protein
MSAMCALALSLKHGEIHPLLAAGVPLYRLSLAFVLGILCVNGLLTANQEWVLPRVAPHLQLSHGETTGDAQRIEPMYDQRYWIIISGRQMHLDRRTIRRAEFYLPTPLVADPVTLRAEEATYLPEKKGRPGGWLLKQVEPAYDKLILGEEGREVVFPQESPESVFVRSEVSFDQLYNRNTSFRYLSTQQLVSRIRRPSAGGSVRRAQLMSLHERVTRPILTLIGIFLVMPLIARREKMSLVSNVALCMATLGVVYGSAQAMLLFGHTGWLKPELCAWLPLGIGGALCAWISPLART